MQDLQGKTAVVTGGASGIGLAMARRFGAEGMQVVIADIEPGAMEDAERDLTSTGVEVLSVRCDVSDWDDVVSLRDTAVERFGRVHLVCNNAGVSGGSGAVWELTLDDWRWTLGVNLWGVIHGMKAFVPHLLEHGEPAHVVNTASMAGHFATPGMGDYATTKFGVVAMSEVLFHELSMTGKPVGCSVLCPGFVATRIYESARNRPEHLSETAPLTPEREAVQQLVAGIIAAGADPADIAEEVLEAVRDDRFWVLPTRETLPGVEARTRTIVEGTDPFNPMAAAGMPSRDT